MKMLTSEQVNGMLERSHDYSDLLKNVKYFDLIISNFYLHPERIDGKLNEHETRKRYSEKNKDGDARALLTYAELCGDG